MTCEQTDLICSVTHGLRLVATGNGMSSWCTQYLVMARAANDRFDMQQVLCMQAGLAGEGLGFTGC